MRNATIAVWLALHLLAGGGAVVAQEEASVVLRNDSVSVRFVDTDLRLAIQSLARYMDRPVLFGTLGEFRITLEMSAGIPVTAVPDVLRGILQTYGMDLRDEGEFYTVLQPGAPTFVEAEQAQQLNLFVIRLRHARAADVAATVSALYGMGSAFGEPGAPRRTLRESLSENLVPPIEQAAPGVPAPVIGMIAELAGDVRIMPDPRTNSLLIRASPRDFELIRAATDQLDVRPLQVLIEVTIAEVRRDRSLAFGVDAFLPPSRIRGTTDTELSGEVVGAGLGDFVLRVMNLGGADLALVLRAAASRGDVSILSRPVVLAANNELAEILVGSQRPFVQVQRALPTDAPIRDQVVQFKDVGTRLSVVPTVSDDGYVMLDVTQEVNAATAEVAFDAPVISTRSVKTQLLVRDGRTAVLGGLADRQKEFTRSGVPFLSRIPILGGLFGGQAVRTTDTELFVFLTPRVIRSDEELEEASQSVGSRTRPMLDRIMTGCSSTSARPGCPAPGRPPDY